MTEMDGDGLVWSLDTTHFPAPATRWSSALFTAMQTRVLRQLMAEAGVLLDGIAHRERNGWIYTAVVPIGGQREEPVNPWLVPVVYRVRRTTRRRLAAAHAADVTDHLGSIVDEWLGGREADLLERGRGYLAGDLTALSPPQVAARLEEQLRFTEECLTWRARLHLAGAGTVGRLGFDLTTRHGWTVAEFLDLFAGMSPASVGPADAQGAILDLVADADAIDSLLVASSLGEVARVSPDVADAIQRYGEVWTSRSVGYEVAAPTIAERPEWLLHLLQATAIATGSSFAGEPAAEHEERRAKAEAKAITTLGGSSANRRRLARAQRAYPLREGNETATIGVPLAGLRRLGLHIGVRLDLDRPDDVFDLTFDEVLAALREPDTHADGPTRARQRREERIAHGDKVPDATIGAVAEARHELTDRRGLPRYAAGLLAGLLWYQEQVDGPAVDAIGANGEGVSGLGVSPGTYEGIARVVAVEEDIARIERGDVLVCPTTSPAWCMVFGSVGAVVCDNGGPLSHPAIIAREFGCPAVVATGSATEMVPDGARVRVDGTNGQVTVVR